VALSKEERTQVLCLRAINRVHSLSGSYADNQALFQRLLRILIKMF
jgi:hypothetical protein